MHEVDIETVSSLLGNISSCTHLIQLPDELCTVQERMMQVQESQNGLQLARETSEREQVLEAQLVEARSIISEQVSDISEQFVGL